MHHRQIAWQLCYWRIFRYILVQPSEFMDPYQVKGIYLSTGNWVAFVMTVSKGVVIINDQTAEARGPDIGVSLQVVIHRLINFRKKLRDGLTYRIAPAEQSDDSTLFPRVFHLCSRS